MLEPLIWKELKKLLDAKIILKFIHFEWVANMIHVKKNQDKSYYV
jgi:hypothetical protein